ncbi:MAG: hypothetical protein HN353_09810 [Bdellovibrionales bacterium]|jgi:hypothetical protein|nr:hypothetical protein [Bdellovibrionales bacterium]MBT3527194.1 hypothetical protein [Bdellovibrionales bacterium]MBT7668488.1 hypothetical protein [Bdellovibrionales bacterium]MBT7765846.1 hypothetical protein [Bdellovibrionales bacterium]
MSRPDKKIFVDAGVFYTKVSALKLEEGVGYRPSGRNFFPSMANSESDPLSPLTYQVEGEMVAVGYDSSQLTLSYDEAKAHPWGWSIENGKALLTKILFDFMDKGDKSAEINFLFEDGDKLAVLKEVVAQFGAGKHPVNALRQNDKLMIKRDVDVTFNFLPASNALIDYLRTIEKSFRKGMVVDISHHKLRIFVLSPEEGVELYHESELGVCCYYERILRLLKEYELERVSYGWMIKQIECGMEEIEIESDELESDHLDEPDDIEYIKAMSLKYLKRDSILVDNKKQHFDVGPLLQNIRWDLNKDIKNLVTENLVEYCTNNATSVDILAIVGGGANLNGEILMDSLEQEEMVVSILTIDRHPFYTLVDSAARESMK